jgi:hypothetical protein
MSKIRLWNLGVLDGVNSIIPNKTAIERLRKILADIPQDDKTHDIVWGPELSVIELGDDKDCETYVIEKMDTENDDSGEYIIIKARKV